MISAHWLWHQFTVLSLEMLCVRMKSKSNAEVNTEQYLGFWRLLNINICFHPQPMSRRNRFPQIGPRASSVIWPASWGEIADCSAACSTNDAEEMLFFVTRRQQHDPEYLKQALVTLLLYNDSSLEISFDSLRHIGCIYCSLHCLCLWKEPIVDKHCEHIECHTGQTLASAPR